jgi:predicted hotdog family 3-hydroxylacyl-ACP dehydratase
MCLLDAVLAWAMTTIACTAPSHRSVGNPLAANDRLDAVCGVEYASQAMAVHGGLIGNGRRPTAGYLASLRVADALAHVLRVFESEPYLRTVDRPGAGAIYRFELTCNAKPALSGRRSGVDAGHLE